MTQPVEHEAGEPWTCPRCGDTVDTFPAVSRTGTDTDPIAICAACGAEETALHQDGAELPTRDQWPVERATPG
jgi:hypothetical protein